MRRFSFRTPAIVALTALAIAAALAMAACSGDDGDGRRLHGTALGGAPSPGFRLVDQQERPVALADFRGSAVVLTFLYTSCPDICPVVADKLARTLDDLGDDASKVAVLAVSVDPARDTPQAAQEFTRAHGLASRNWRFLTGSEADLMAVWKAYGIFPGEATAHEGEEHGSGSADPATLAHTDALYLIDRDGKQRALLRSDVSVADLAADLRALVK